MQGWEVRSLSVRKHRENESGQMENHIVSEVVENMTFVYTESIYLCFCHKTQCQAVTKFTIKTTGYEFVGELYSMWEWEHTNGWMTLEIYIM